MKSKRLRGSRHIRLRGDGDGPEAIEPEENLTVNGSSGWTRADLVSLVGYLV